MPSLQLICCPYQDGRRRSCGAGGWIPALRPRPLQIDQAAEPLRPCSRPSGSRTSRPFLSTAQKRGPGSLPRTCSQSWREGRAEVGGETGRGLRALPRRTLNRVGPVLARLRSILLRPQARNILGQSESPEERSDETPPPISAEGPVPAGPFVCSAGRRHPQPVLIGGAAGELPAGPLMTCCGHGERAMMGASLLERAGQKDLRQHPPRLATAPSAPSEACSWRGRCPKSVLRTRRQPGEVPPLVKLGGQSVRAGLLRR
jgi:hypothetical protein